MTSSRINSPEAIQSAVKVVRAFGGSWENVKLASTQRADGVHVIHRSSLRSATEADHDR
ncbi:hypothetical protein [Novosphingobium sp. Chol11]|uniref:hypothetical protein n=1 Tax=Novosphingobium sp. Chol11 TaxID=1385763 RepID=UPI0025CC7267|nr:hypothetical protein [Novosphingobium sp. Chol11]